MVTKSSWDLGQQDSFSSGSANLRASFEGTLRSVGAAINDVGGIIRVEGHTDNGSSGLANALNQIGICHQQGRRQ